MLLEQSGWQYLIFKTGDKMRVDQIYSAFANTVSREQFEEVQKEVTGTNPHGILYIHAVPKEPLMRFRKELNKFLVPPPELLRNNKQQKVFSRKRQRHHYNLDTKYDTQTQPFPIFTHQEDNTSDYL